MKRIVASIIAIISVVACGQAADPLATEWSRISGGSKGAEWYGSQEAVAIADTLLAVQKVSGGWGKNIGYHCLTQQELSELKATCNDRSCLDNSATYNEMRYLARVWKATGEERFRASFEKALKMLLKAEKIRGGWSQYYPLYDNGSYNDFITYNDNLMVNVMRMLHDVDLNLGNYENIVDADTRALCRAAFERGIDLTLKLQINDNGVKAGWCAQYDPADNMACWARRFEPPSVSGYESFAILSYLMSLSQPSPQMQEAIIAAVEWFDKHKIEDKALEEFVNADGERDFRIIDKPGSNLWGRFIQLGGESGKKMYDKFFEWLRLRNKSHSYIYEGVKYTYTEIEGVKDSYREDMAYQPIYSSHRDDQPHMDYRFLYNYEDTDPVIDKKGCLVFTSLTAPERTAYCYIGDWGEKVLYKEYPVWKEAVDLLNLGGDLTGYELSGETCLSSDERDYTFTDGFVVSNQNGKTYQMGNNSTVKFSARTQYSITIPEGLQVSKIAFYGYDNYDADAYLSELNGKTFGTSDYVFPAKVEGAPQYVTHLIDLTATTDNGTSPADAPGSNRLTFTLGSKQCCLKVFLYCEKTASPTPDPENPGSGVQTPASDSRLAPPVLKHFQNGRVILSTPSCDFLLTGQPLPATNKK